MNTQYKTVNGTSYKLDTPQDVINILENSRLHNSRLKIYYGDTLTGKDWMEEHDTTGTVGRSTGEIKIPLLIPSSKSMGGGGILDNCIVRIKRNGVDIYRHKNYHSKEMKIVPSKEKGYSHSIIMDGNIYSNHKSEISAKRLITKLS